MEGQPLISPDVIARYAADAALAFVVDGLNKAMNKYNGSIEMQG